MLSKILFYILISYIETKLKKKELKVQGGLFKKGTNRGEEKQERAKGTGA